jgi:HSP20 family protein
VFDTRSFTLPEGVNTSAIHADLNDGVLSVVLPKKPEAQAQQIPVTTDQKQKKA